MKTSPLIGPKCLALFSIFCVSAFVGVPVNSLGTRPPCIERCTGASSWSNAPVTPNDLDSDCGVCEGTVQAQTRQLGSCVLVYAGRFDNGCQERPNLATVRKRRQEQHHVDDDEQLRCDNAARDCRAGVALELGVCVAAALVAPEPILELVCVANAALRSYQCDCNHTECKADCITSGWEYSNGQTGCVS